MENKEKQKFTVEVSGIRMTVVTDEGQEEVMSVAEAVDARISEVMLSARYISRLEAALFVCLDACAEKRRMQKKLNEVSSQNALLAARVNQLQMELDRQKPGKGKS